MELWIIYFAGWNITLITGDFIRNDNNLKDLFDNLDVTSRLNWKKAIIIILISISVTIVGGMTAGRLLAELILDGSEILDIILPTVIATICTYGVESWILRFSYINKKSRIFFKAIFLISILCWGTFLYHYNQNIEMIEEKKLESKKVEEVVYFSLKDSNINCLYRGNGKKEYECISIDDAKIDVDEDREEAYVEIYIYHVTTKKINNNNRKTEILDESEERKYDFYLNSKVMK